MLKVILNKNEEADILNGFPWVYSNEVNNFEGPIVSGDICEVLDNNRHFVGYGFFNANSKLMVRMLSLNQEDKIDKEFFKKRIQYALSHRNNLHFEDSNCMRLIFSEADYLPGLVVDKYDEILVISISVLGMDNIKKVIVDILVELLNPKGIYERSDSPSRLKEGLDIQKGYLYNEFDPKVLVNENGIQFYVDVQNGQKTGYFLDQKINRDNLKYYVKDKIVLDCFSNVGGFALNALKHGAKKVLATDISELACSQILENAALNNFKNIEVRCADVFELLKEEELKNQFDVIVLDPPAFTKNKETLKNAYRGYKEINMSAMKLIKSGGYLMTFSCSQLMNQELFIQMLKEALKDSGRKGQFISFNIQAPDHITLFNNNEQLYLKEVILRIE